MKASCDGDKKKMEEKKSQRGLAKRPGVVAMPPMMSGRQQEEDSISNSIPESSSSRHNQKEKRGLRKVNTRQAANSNHNNVTGASSSYAAPLVKGGLRNNNNNNDKRNGNNKANERNTTATPSSEAAAPPSVVSAPIVKGGLRRNYNHHNQQTQRAFNARATRCGDDDEDNDQGLHQQSDEPSNAIHTRERNENSNVPSSTTPTNTESAMIPMIEDPSDSLASTDQDQADNLVDNNSPSSLPVEEDLSDTPQLQHLPMATNTSSRDLLADGNLVEARLLSSFDNDDDDHDAMELAQAQQVDPNEILAEERQKQKRRQCRRIGLAVVALGMGSMILALVLGYQQQSDEPAVAITTSAPTNFPSLAPSIAPSLAPTFLIDDLPNSTREVIDSDLNSPQALALQWLYTHRDLANDTSSRMPEWRKQQLLALATFYFAFDGDSWIKEAKEDWLTDEKSECDWFSDLYVDADIEGSVSSSFYSVESYEFKGDNQLSLNTSACQNGRFVSLLLRFLPGGFLPQELSLLTNLRHIALWDIAESSAAELMIPGFATNLTVLSFERGKLYGPLPSIIGLLTALTTLNLEQNYLNGTIPSEVGNLNLTKLKAKNNKFVGELPSQVGRLTNLEWLDLYGNQISGLPPEFGNLTSLRHLNLANNQVSMLPTEIGRLTSLREWYVYGNGIKTIPSEIANIPWRKLDFEFNSLSGDIPSELATNMNLTTLKLDENQFRSIPSALALMTNLESIDLSYNIIEGPLPNLRSLTNLKSLRLSYNRINGTLDNLPLNLTNIDFESNLLTGTLPTTMHPNISALYLSLNELTGTIPSVIGIWRFLDGINLSYNDLSGTIPTELGLLSTYVCTEWKDETSCWTGGGLGLGGLHLASNSGITGTLPSELGNLRHVSCIDLRDTSITGTIPLELCPRYCDATLCVTCGTSLNCTASSCNCTPASCSWSC